MIAVKLQYNTPLHVARDAGLICTASLDKKEEYDPQEFINARIEEGHLSLIEHITYTFYVKDISRALLQELARHRLMSLSVESTRWALKKNVKKGTFQNKLQHIYNTYLSKLKTEKQEALVVKAMTLARNLEGLVVEMADANIPNDLIKYFIVEATTTNLFMTINARQLRHLFQLRIQKNVLQEFQELVRKLRDAVPLDHVFMLGVLPYTPEKESA